MILSAPMNHLFGPLETASFFIPPGPPNRHGQNDGARGKGPDEVPTQPPGFLAERTNRTNQGSLVRRLSEASRRHRSRHGELGIKTMLGAGEDGDAKVGRGKCMKPSKDGCRGAGRAVYMKNQRLGD